MRRRRPRAVGVSDVADESVDEPLLIGRADLVADDLLRERDRRGGHLAAQVFLRLLHLLLDDELGLFADPAGTLLRRRDQTPLLGLRLLLDARGDGGDLLLERPQALLLLLAAPLA